MKKWIALLLVLSICLLFAACGSEAEEQVPATELNTEPDRMNMSITEAEETESVEETVPEYLTAYISYAYDFSDGIAWVEFYNPNTESECKGLLHTSGEIFALEEELQGYRVGTPFSGGYAYVLIDNGFCILDQYGNITTEQIAEDGSTYRIIAGGDGVYLVYQEIRTMTVNEDRYGIIRYDGEWLVELSTESPLGIGYADRTYNPIEFYYLGNHIFAADENGFSSDQSRKLFYDADTNELCNVKGPITFLDSNDEPIAPMNGLVPNINYRYSGFDTGYAVYFVDVVNDEAVRTVKGFEYMIFSEDVFFGSEWDAGYATDGAFYDTEGNKIIDLSKYELVVHDVPGYYEFHDGIAVIMIRGADGENYIGYIDMNGEFLFEPYKLENFNGYKRYSECVNNTVYAAVSLKEGWMEAILTSDGELIEPDRSFDNSNSQYESPYYAAVKFCDGFSRNEDYTCFIGMDGTVLPVYIKNSLYIAP